MPRVRFGQVHVHNDYVSNRNTLYPDNTYCIAAGYEAELLVENNFFDEAKLSGQGPAFVPPYTATLEPADDVLRNTIRHCAGVH